MPNLAAVKTQFDGRITAFIASSTPTQNGYRGSHGGHNFFQGIISTPIASLPVQLDGSGTINTTPNGNQRPTDQAETWNAAGMVFPPNLPGALEVFQYVGPRGDGWVVNAYFKHTLTTNLYLKVTNIGPETERTADWILIDLTKVPGL